VSALLNCQGGCGQFVALVAETSVSWDSNTLQIIEGVKTHQEPYSNQVGMSYVSVVKEETQL
jgi:hypothetical protein